MNIIATMLTLTTTAMITGALSTLLCLSIGVLIGLGVIVVVEVINMFIRVNIGCCELLLLTVKSEFTVGRIIVLLAVVPNKPADTVDVAGWRMSCEVVAVPNKPAHGSGKAHYY